MVRYPVPSVPTCLRCRRETERREGSDLELRLDGPELLAALRAQPREDLDEEQREMVDRIAAGLCLTCGRAL